jgi:hypothetical protein
MTLIPPNTVTAEDMSSWYQMQEQLKKLKAAEMLLRQKIFGFYFPAPKEGINTIPLDAGWVLKGKHTISREVDPGAFGALKEQFLKAGIAADSMVQYKPSLFMKEYRTLTEEQMHLFDQCLIVKPGSPALEIVLPAKAAKATGVQA